MIRGVPAVSWKTKKENMPFGVEKETGKLASVIHFVTKLDITGNSSTFESAVFKKSSLEILQYFYQTKFLLLN